MQLRGKNYPITLSGTIWIEPQTGDVAKLVASMKSSLSDLGLQAMRSEIHYATVDFRELEQSYWMPVSAVIDVETLRHDCRNIHPFCGLEKVQGHPLSRRSPV